MPLVIAGKFVGFKLVCHDELWPDVVSMPTV